jgi:RNA polymerase sigma factor (sigma-70 family)
MSGGPTGARASGSLFPPTRWSVVLAARQAPSAVVDAALETLCLAYWYPLYAHARRRGCTAHDAEDLTQGFFCRLLEKQWLEDADRGKGRLRSFLIAAFKNYMANEWRRATAGRRGGGREFIPLDTSHAEDRYAVAPAPRLAPDAAYDREWALMLLDRALERLRAESATDGRAEDFDALKDCLMAGRGDIDYEAVAARLGATAGAARVAVHRLRKRFRVVFREEVAQTLGEGADIGEEMRHLADSLVLV